MAKKTNTHKDNLLDQLRIQFKSRMDLFKPELQRWIQFQGWEVDPMTDYLTLTFRSSQAPIFFNVSCKAFTCVYGEFHLNHNETYEFFRLIKYNEVMTAESEQSENPSHFPPTTHM